MYGFEMVCTEMIIIIMIRNRMDATNTQEKITLSVYVLRTDDKIPNVNIKMKCELRGKVKQIATKWFYLHDKGNLLWGLSCIAI